MLPVRAPVPAQPQARLFDPGSSPEPSVHITAGEPPEAPSRPWVMRQRWNDLLFAHWPMPPASLERLLPPGLAIDTFDGQGWLGVVPFTMDQIQFRGLPRLPGANRFPELNLRTYVRERNTNRAGVYFFSLDAANPLAVTFARTRFHLPYFWARMRATTKGREIHYQSQRLLTRPAHFHARYRSLGGAAQGPAEHFLTARYSLFTVGWGGRLLEGRIHHMPWPLERAEAEFERNELPASFGLTLPNTAPLLHYSRELAVYVWSLEPTPLQRGALRSVRAAAVPEIS
jgi:uncharacterized protein